MVQPVLVFLIVISAAISLLGLLMPSVAVLIGAMLLSPLMMPILGEDRFVIDPADHPHRPPPAYRAAFVRGGFRHGPC
jgi:hypothetical protein